MPIYATVLFMALSAILLVLSVTMLAAEKLFHSAVALTAALAIVAALFALLGADFVAAGQLLIYVGGVTVLILFVVMLFQPTRGPRKAEAEAPIFWALMVGVAIAGILIRAYYEAFRGIQAGPGIEPSTLTIGQTFLGAMAAPFEIVSLVLLAALVGIVLFGAGDSSETK